MNLNLEKMSVSELRALQDSIKSALKKREQEELTKAREQILAIAQSVGVSVKDLIGTGARVKNSVAMQYRNPADATQQWSGRGRQPKWVKEWVESGKSLDAARV
jgi:DNA-binding protein H-NS